MYNQPYFIPGYLQATVPNMMRGSLSGAGMASRAASAGRGIGLFSRLGSGLSAFKGINWGNLITNTSKTLNVVNQAIPLVRQVGPMFNNVKSMVRLASVFKDETDVRVINRENNNVPSRNITSSLNNSSSINTITDNKSINIKDEDYSPTFFVDV